MIIFNTTYHVSDSREREFIEWVKSSYIPKAVQCGTLTQPQFTLIMGREEGGDGNSYSLQFHAPSVDALEVWYRRTGAALVAEIERQFGTHVAGFSTLMQKIEI